MKAVRKAIATALAGTALACVAHQTSAMPVDDLGVLRGKAVLTTTDSLPQYAWDGTAGLGQPPHNDGWTHTSVWHSFTLKRRSHVTIRLTANGQLNPAFSVWKTGGAFDGANHTSHSYNQIGIGGASTFLSTGPTDEDKVTDFVGYANSGVAFTGGGGPIQHGGTYGARVAEGYARLLAVDLLPGQYLIVVGGSCYTDGTTKACGGEKVDATLKITRSAAP